MMLQSPKAQSNIDTKIEAVKAFVGSCFGTYYTLRMLGIDINPLKLIEMKRKNEAAINSLYGSGLGPDEISLALDRFRKQGYWGYLMKSPKSKRKGVFFNPTKSGKEYSLKYFIL
jgi:hypothetical protein